ncbi:unnamed protein product [Urochloa humidicola]
MEPLAVREALPQELEMPLELELLEKLEPLVKMCRRPSPCRCRHPLPGRSRRPCPLPGRRPCPSPSRRRAGMLSSGRTSQPPRCIAVGHWKVKSGGSGGRPGKRFERTGGGFG